MATRMPIMRAVEIAMPARPRAMAFRVWDEGRAAYVESIDGHDGDTEWTTRPADARLFRGVRWRRSWTRPGLRLLEVDEHPAC